MSDLDLNKIQFPQLNLDYTNNLVNSAQQDFERNMQAIQKAKEEKEEEELRRHNELIEALKFAGENGATIVVGNNAKDIQILQNSAGAQQSLIISQELNYDKAADILKEICSYFDFPQFDDTFGENSNNVKNIVKETLQAVNEQKDKNIIKKSLGILKELAMQTSVSLISSGILALLGQIPL